MYTARVTVVSWRTLITVSPLATLEESLILWETAHLVWLWSILYYTKRLTTITTMIGL